MKTFAAFIVTSFLVIPSAFATWIVPVADQICTRDFNLWGQASSCQCPQATRYENRIGACVQGAPVEVSVEGYVSAVANLEDGTVTYNLRKNENETYKVVLPLELRPLFDDASLQGVKFRISGEMMENYDGSVDGQPTLIISKIEALDLIPETLAPNLPEVKIVP